MANYPLENRLREPTELYVALTYFALATLSFMRPSVFLLTPKIGLIVTFGFSLLGMYRFYQGYRVKRYQKRLLKMPRYHLKTRQIPYHLKKLFLGKGFLWLPKHTQRLHQIKQVNMERYLKPSLFYRAMRILAGTAQSNLLGTILNTNHWLNPFKPLPEVGGKPWLHGLGDEDKTIFIPQSVRNGHIFVLGTTRVGKTRLSSILAAQDILNGEAVIFIDPKGDLELVKDMMMACELAGRIEDFQMVHLGFPELSSFYNPLSEFSDPSEVATRIADAIDAEGEGKQFKAFAWKYLNIVICCLHEMGLAINYESIGFYITRLDQLLVIYADTVLIKFFPTYEREVENILAKGLIKPSHKPMRRTDAILNYFKAYIESEIASGKAENLYRNTLVALIDGAQLDKVYYDKITASVGPVLAAMNQSQAAPIFSTQSEQGIKLIEAIKQKKIIYIGLDSLSNYTISQGFGKALLSDLVSTAGRLYKEMPSNHKLCLHCDELSEIIQTSFVKILNKAGGAGFQITVYAQTKQDLEVALGSKALAEATKGNLNTLIMLRVENEETANLLVNVLPKVDVVSHTEVSTVSDTPHAKEGVFFNTVNEDRVQKTAIPMLEVNDIISLPKGQAFVWVNGGELYKVRMPLPVNENVFPKGIKSILKQIKKVPEPLPPAEAESSKFKENINPISNKKTIDGFTRWLEKRIKSGQKQFSVHAQVLVFQNEDYPNYLFVTQEVLGKYEASSQSSVQKLKNALEAETKSKKPYFIEQDEKMIEVFPCPVNQVFKGVSTRIIEGENDVYRSNA